MMTGRRRRRYGDERFFFRPLKVMIFSETGGEPDIVDDLYDVKASFNRKKEKPVEKVEITCDTFDCLEYDEEPKAEICFCINDECAFKTVFKDAEISKRDKEMIKKVYAGFLETHYEEIIYYQDENFKKAKEFEKDGTSYGYSKLCEYYRNYVKNDEMLFMYAKKWALKSSRGRNYFARLCSRYNSKYNNPDLADKLFTNRKRWRNRF